MAKSKKKSTSISRSSRPTSKKISRPNKRIPPRNPDGSIKISMIKREYRLVEQHGDKIVVTSHFALNKGPGDAAVKLARPFFKDRNDGSKVRITITKISDGRNKGALYEYEILQKHMLLKPGEAAPKGIVIEKNGKKYRLKRYATKLKTYTPSSQKKIKQADTKREAHKNPEKNDVNKISANAKNDDNKISANAKNEIKKILSSPLRGRISKSVRSSSVSTSKKSKSSDTSSDEQTHVSVSDD
jgi:hypothetical protein